MTKPALLLLPGMLCDATFWHAQVEGLADLCTPQVVSYGQACSFTEMAELVLEQAPASFALAGHSMGGRVALEVVRRAPRRVQRLALLCTDYRGHESEGARAAEALNRERMLANARQNGMKNFARSWFVSQVAPPQATNAAMIDAMAAMGAAHTPAQLAAEFEAGLSRQDYGALLHDITCPTLVCTGEFDWLRPVANHQRMAAQIPNARLVIIAESGHMVAMEQPTAVTEAMRSWLLDQDSK